MKKEKLIIKCFDKWWRATIEVQDTFDAMNPRSAIIVSPAVRMASKIIYNETQDNFIVNEPNVDSGAIATTLFMLKNKLPKLPMDRKGFERLRKQYSRKIKYDF